MRATIDFAPQQLLRQRRLPGSFCTGSLSMRILRALTPAVCLAATVLTLAPRSTTQTPLVSRHQRALPGPMDVLVAAPGNRNYAYGPSRLHRLGMAASVAPSATFVVTYSGFGAFPAAQAAFQAAVDIWAHTIVSSTPIRVNATFASLGTNVLGQAGPSMVCQPSIGAANTYYAAALADALDNSIGCAASQSSEIIATFNSDFTSWDFGTSGTGV